MDEPIAITNLHLIAAMAETDPRDRHGERSWCVTDREVDYSLKHVVSRASEYPIGEEHSRFHTRRAAKLVENLGFTTTEKE